MIALPHQNQNVSQLIESDEAKRINLVFFFTSFVKSQYPVPAVGNFETQDSHASQITAHALL